jgi:hypothetical protein
MASRSSWQSRLESARRSRLWPQSLHDRLVVIPSTVLTLGLLGTTGIIFLHARSRISVEVMSSVQLAHELAITAPNNIASAGGRFVVFAALAYDMPRVRHVQFHLAAIGGAALPVTPRQWARRTDIVPLWFWVARHDGRVRRVGGLLSVNTMRPRVIVAITVPSHEPRAMESVHADSVD